MYRSFSAAGAVAMLIAVLYVMVRVKGVSTERPQRHPRRTEPIAPGVARVVSPPRSYNDSLGHRGYLIRRYGRIAVAVSLATAVGCGACYLVLA